MPDLSKIEAWIQQQDDELYYDPDGPKAAHRLFELQTAENANYILHCSTVTLRVGTISEYDPPICSTISIQRNVSFRESE